MRKPVVLITGAGGEIGHGLIERLAGQSARAVVTLDVARLDSFFARWPDAFDWVRPRAGSIGYPRLTVPGVALDDWAARLVETEGVLLLPGSQFGDPGDHFRIGFGREDLPDALARLEAFAERTLRA